MKGAGLEREREGRLGRRLPLGVWVFLTSMENCGLIETTRTENVGPQGLRLMSQRPWRASQDVLIQVSHTNLRLRGQVVYCLPRPDGRFAVGVALTSPSVNWADMPPEAAAS